MISCPMARDRLDRYLDGALDPEERRAVGDHLASCGDCRAEFDTGAFVRERTRGISREIAPPRDLWSGIAPRLARRSWPRRLDLPLWSLAAAALVLVVASSAVTVAWLGRAGPPAASAGFAATESGYARAALDLTDLYARSRERLAPETRTVLERNLAVIERALAESRDALRQDPANRALEAMVVAAYQRKIAFLERATALDRDL